MQLEYEHEGYYDSLYDSCVPHLLLPRNDATAGAGRSLSGLKIVSYVSISLFMLSNFTDRMSEVILISIASASLV